MTDRSGTAEQPTRDLAAEFIFNVTFDARANNKRIGRRRHGRPHGTGFRTVPPNGNGTACKTIVSLLATNQFTIAVAEARTERP